MSDRLRSGDGFAGRGDDFYEALITAHHGLTAEESRALDARLVLLLANEVGDVAAEPVLVGGGVGRLVDAGVDAAAHVLDERPEDASVDLPDDECGIEHDPGLRHPCLPRRCGIGHVSYTTLEQRCKQDWTRVPR